MKRKVLRPNFSPETGLVTVVVVHRYRHEGGFPGGTILMLAHANLEAYRLTLETGYAHFWSRSRKQLWKKGETSGNLIPVYRITADCDEDALIYYTDKLEGIKACHEGRVSCFLSGGIASHNNSHTTNSFECEVSDYFD